MTIVKYTFACYETQVQYICNAHGSCHSPDSGLPGVLVIHEH